MFEQKDSQLRRLEEELLREEQAANTDPDGVEDILFEEDAGDLPQVQVPYRNFFNGYQAYTNQPSGVDLDSYSEDVRTGGEKSNAPLVILALTLFICILMVLCWWVWRYAEVLL